MTRATTRAISREVLMEKYGRDDPTDPKTGSLSCKIWCFFDEPTVTGFLLRNHHLRDTSFYQAVFVGMEGWRCLYRLKSGETLGKRWKSGKMITAPSVKGTRRRVLEIPLYPLSCSGGAARHQ